MEGSQPYRGAAACFSTVLGAGALAGNEEALTAPLRIAGGSPPDTECRAEPGSRIVRS